MGVLLGGICVLAFCSCSPKEPEHFWLSSLAVPVVDGRFVSLSGAGGEQQHVSPRTLLLWVKRLQANELKSHWALRLFTFLPVLPAQCNPNGCSSDNYRLRVLCRLPEPVGSSKHE